MQYNNYTELEFIEAVKQSKSIAEVLRRLNLVVAGGNYSTIRNKIKDLNLSQVHMTGQASNKGRKFGPKRALVDYLSNKYRIASYKLKNKLIAENIFVAQCDNCKLTTWLDSSIPLELHYIDGDHMNNNLLNLQLLCPNCHTLTDNYRGKGIGRGTRT